MVSKSPRLFDECIRVILYLYQRPLHRTMRLVAPQSTDRPQNTLQLRVTPLPSLRYTRVSLQGALINFEVQLFAER